MSTEDPNTPEASNVIAQRLYGEFKWSLKTGAYPTYGAIVGLVNETMKRCLDEIPHPAVKAAVVARFSEMRNRLSEFDVEEECDAAEVFGPDVDSASPAEVLGRCMKCSREIKAGEPHEKGSLGLTEGLMCVDCLIKCV